MGEELDPLDINKARNFTLEVKNNVAAFAISSFFSIRNPNHEIAIRDIVHNLTGMPVVCGHELPRI